MKRNIKAIAQVQQSSQLHKFFKGITVVSMSIAMISLTGCSKNKEEETFKKPAIETSKEEEVVPESSESIEDLELVLVEGGSFLMGSSYADKESQGDERPQHRVTLSDFKVSKYEITNAQYAKFLTAKGNEVEDRRKWYQGKDIEQNGNVFTPKAGKENYPVVFVSWYGANAYAKWAGGKLPTEAEFEYILRGGNKKVNQDGIFADEDGSGKNIDDYAWYRKNSGGKSHPVGQKKPNELGLYDVNGNVWEWTADWYGYYSNADQVDPTGAEQGTYRVRRGASFSCSHDKCRIANRGTYISRDGQVNIGFRVVFPAK